MKGKWVKDYPEASEKYEEYKQVVDNLRNYVATISEVVNMSAPTVLQLTDATGMLAGVYYDTYFDEVKTWCEDVSKLKSDISLFETELNKRIQSAESKKELWRSRISMGHYEYESEEEECTLK